MSIDFEWAPSYPEIKPCPFCNCTGELHRFCGEVRVVCEGCKSLGPSVPIKIEKDISGIELMKLEITAINAWNERGVVKNV